MFRVVHWCSGMFHVLAAKISHLILRGIRPFWVNFIAELRWPEGLPSGAPYPYREKKGNPWIDFLMSSRPAVFLVGAHDGGDDGGSHNPSNTLIEACCPGLPCTFLIYDIMLWTSDTCKIELSADQYHVTISRAQVYSSSRSRILL